MARAAIGLTLASGLVVGSVVAQATVIPVEVSNIQGAEAHTGDLKVKATCVSGVYQLTYTLTLANVPNGVTATKVESHTGPQNFPAGWSRATYPDWIERATNVPANQSTVSWTTTLPGTTVGNGPWELAVSTFSDNFVVNSDTRVEGLKGDCTPPPKQVTPVLHFSPGDCQNPGSADAVDTPEYTWTYAGPNTARVYTAHPVGNVILTQTTFGPYDMTKTDYKNPACKPWFEVEKSCGYIKITYHNESQWIRYPDYRYSGDGVLPKDAGSGPYYTPVAVNPGETKVIFEKTFTEDYNGGEVEVQYQDILGAERDIDTAAVIVKVPTNCQPDVIPATPVAIVDGDCVVNGSGSLATTAMSNPFPGLPNTVGTDAVFIEKIDGVDQPSVTIAPNGAQVNHSFPFGEDTGDHLVQVYDDKGNLLGAKVVGSNCAATITVPDVQRDCVNKVTKGSGEGTWSTIKETLLPNGDTRYEADFTPDAGKVVLPGSGYTVTNNVAHWQVDVPKKVCNTTNQLGQTDLPTEWMAFKALAAAGAGLLITALMVGVLVVLILGGRRLFGRKTA